MKFKQKKLPNDEIDLSKVINDILNNKWKIFLITMITVIIAIFSKMSSQVPKEETTFLVKTDILPISTFAEHEYSAFNTYLINLINSENTSLMQTAGVTEEQNKLSFQNYFIKNNTFLKPINKDYLYKLFVEKLNQKKIILDGVKKTNLLKKENYPNIKSYEDAITKLANSISINHNSETNLQSINFKVKNKKIWEDFLNYIQENANLEIQYYLKNNFELYVINANRLIKYKIEDIQFEIDNNLEDKIFLDKLKKIKKRIEKDKDSERLRYLFENTPINISEDFIAAKFDTQLSVIETKKTRNNSMKTTIFMSIFLGLILGTMYIIIESRIKRLR